MPAHGLFLVNTLSVVMRQETMRELNMHCYGFMSNWAQEESRIILSACSARLLK